MHEQEIGIAEGHTLNQTKTEWKQKKGQDTDTYWYDELNEEGEVVAQYVLWDTTSMHPPFGRTITFEKI